MCRVVWRSEFENRAAAAKCYCGNGKYERWGDVRFRIERHAKMVIVDLADFAAACAARKRYPIAGDACVVGILESQLKQPRCFVLADDTLMADLPQTEHIVLIRVPNGRSPGGGKRTNTYMPPVFRQKYRAAAAAKRRAELQTLMDQTKEDSKKLHYAQLVERLCVFGSEDMHSPSAVDEVRAAGRVYRRAKAHPSTPFIRERYAGYVGERGALVPWVDVPPETPPDHYVCHRCLGYFAAPHFNANCPSHAVLGWIPMKQRRRPTGIPVSDRIKVPDSAPLEVVATAPYRDLDGTLWTTQQPGPAPKRSTTKRPTRPADSTVPTKRPRPRVTADAIADLWAEPNPEAEYLYA